MAKKTKKNIKVRDLKPTKDAKGGFAVNSPHLNKPVLDKPVINNPHLS
jgi:hypothetical protein